jgi:hypothetical protein
MNGRNGRNSSLSLSFLICSGPLRGKGAAAAAAAAYFYFYCFGFCFPICCIYDIHLAFWL